MAERFHRARNRIGVARWSQGDFLTVDQAFDAGSWRRTEEKLVSASQADFPPDWVIEEIVGEGDKVSSHFTWRYTHRGEFFGVPATGIQITVKGMVVERVGTFEIANRSYPKPIRFRHRGPSRFSLYSATSRRAKN